MENRAGAGALGPQVAEVGLEVSGPGRRSAAVVDAEALGDVLAAQRASTQGLAALLAAADVAAVEEDHLRLRRERGSVWAPARPGSLGMGQGRPPAAKDLTARSSCASQHRSTCRRPSWSLSGPLCNSVHVFHPHPISPARLLDAHVVPNFWFFYALCPDPRSQNHPSIMD